VGGHPLQHSRRRLCGWKNPAGRSHWTHPPRKQRASRKAAPAAPRARGAHRLVCDAGGGLAVVGDDLDRHAPAAPAAEVDAAKGAGAHWARARGLGRGGAGQRGAARARQEGRWRAQEDGRRAARGQAANRGPTKAGASTSAQHPPSTPR
jgi:hypothetical protein